MIIEAFILQYVKFNKYLPIKRYCFIQSIFAHILRTILLNSYFSPYKYRSSWVKLSRKYFPNVNNTGLKAENDKPKWRENIEMKELKIPVSYNENINPNLRSSFHFAASHSETPSHCLLLNIAVFKNLYKA